MRNKKNKTIDSQIYSEHRAKNKKRKKQYKKNLNIKKCGYNTTLSQKITKMLEV